MGIVVNNSAIIAVMGLIALIVGLCKCKNYALRLVESFILIATVLLLAFGTRETVLNLVDKNASKIVISGNKSKAVLQAYKQLSEEQSRWFVMFVVLGSFFGIVLPIGSYLLQIRTVSHKENEVDDRLKMSEEKCLAAIERDRGRAIKEMECMRTEFDNNVKKLWRSQVVMAHERFRSAISDAEEGKWEFSIAIRRELLSSLLLVLMYLEMTDDKAFILREVKKLADEVIKVSQKTVEVDCDTWTKGFKRQMSGKRIDLQKYFVDSVDDLSRISEFLKRFGILVLS